MIYKSEEEFLKAYNPEEFDRLSLTTDILVLSISDEEVSNYRKTSKKHMSVLLVKRKDYPFKDKWCLPGGFLNIDEDLEDCPRRILSRETNLHDIYLEQLYTFGGINRDPRMRIISTSYMALIDKNRLDYKISDNASWFNINYELEGNKVYVWEDDGGERIQVALTMTCPKTPVGAAMASPEPASAFDNYITPNGEFVSVQKNTTEITPEEQQTIKDLMARLGL